MRPTLVIWKFDLPLSESVIEIPHDAELLSVDVQRNEARLWALVNPAQPIVRRRIVVRTTGQDFEATEPPLKFVGTLLFGEGVFVAHVFDGGELP